MGTRWRLGAKHIAVAFLHPFRAFEHTVLPDLKRDSG